MASSRFYLQLVGLFAVVTIALAVDGVTKTVRGRMVWIRARLSEGRVSMIQPLFVGPRWHALLAPLPDGFIPRRQPVTSPEILATPEGESIAGWEQVRLDLSAEDLGLRIVVALLDAGGRLLSASDTVLFWKDGPAPSGPRWLRQESLGGGFSADGSFRGSRWLTEGPAPRDGDTATLPSERYAATADEGSMLRRLVEDLVRRSDSTEAPAN